MGNKMTDKATKEAITMLPGYHTQTAICLLKEWEMPNEKKDEWLTQVVICIELNREQKNGNYHIIQQAIWSEVE